MRKKNFENTKSLSELTLPGEIWKNISNVNHGVYKVSSLGRVYSQVSAKIMVITPRKDSEHTGYCYANLGKTTISKITNNEVLRKKSYSVHRLVAQAFIPNPLNKKEVNHKNKNRSDNRVENLEWVSRSENARHKFGKSDWNQWQDKTVTSFNNVKISRKLIPFTKMIVPMLNKMIPIRSF